MTHSHRILSVASMLVVAAAASASAPSQPESATVAPANVALAAPAAVAPVQVTTPTDGFPEIQAGVRRAAEQGNDVLRRYIWRTRMIYNFYFYDFAKPE
ncbi:MAG TPA: hypothetical protein VFB32_02985 [Rudaea sp.]|nr:hypothetical protein [Rudaea sp.]